MIIFINGSFGSGKTTTAELLEKQIPNSMIFDPEEVGFFLRNVLGEIDPQPDDFQHYKLWRSLTVEMAKRLLDEYDKVLIMPMTIWRKEYFDEVITGLRAIDQKTYHFCLIASPSTIQKRLHGRGQGPGGWAEKQIKDSLSAFESPDYEVKISTDEMKPSMVVAEIMKQLK
ncbi:MAG: AAA family ATPase [Parcubacteria group bacterium]|nr:AAA family ATPase [Parcubacteria group bacterium]